MLYGLEGGYLVSTRIKFYAQADLVHNDRQMGAGLNSQGPNMIFGRRGVRR